MKVDATHDAAPANAWHSGAMIPALRPLDGPTRRSTAGRLGCATSVQGEKRISNPMFPADSSRPFANSGSNDIANSHPVQAPRK